MRPIDADFLIDCIKPQLGTGDALFDEVMKKFIGILEATPTIDAVSEWIPCSEKLPNEGELVLVSNPYISGVGYYRNRHWYIANNVSWDAWSTTDVVAWMPLPKPWKGESHDR